MEDGEQNDREKENREIIESYHFRNQIKGLFQRTFYLIILKKTLYIQ